MKKILVPTDFSAFAEAATDMAILIAQRSNAEVHFVHLMDTPIDWLNLSGDEQKKFYPDVTAKVRSANNKMENLISKVDKAGLKSKKLIQFNSNYKYVTAYAEKLQCDLIVMGSHGVSGFVDWFVGSNTQKIVRTSTIPVLVVKKGYEVFRFDEIIFASEFNPDHLQSFERVLDFAKVMGSKIKILFINTPSNFIETKVIEQKMKPFLEKGGSIISANTVYNSYDFEKGISECVNNSDVMLSITSHKSKYSLTENIVNHINNPVLTLPM